MPIGLNNSCLSQRKTKDNNKNVLSFQRFLSHHISAAAAIAKSIQSCPTLWDPIDGSPPGSPVPGLLQARTLEWVAISFSSAWKWKVKVKSFSRVQLFAIPWIGAYQAPPSMGFSRQRILEWGAIAFSWHYSISSKFRISSSKLFTSEQMKLLNIHRKDWCWNWSSNTLATWREEPTDWKRSWCWENWRQKEREWQNKDGWLASPT